MFKAISSLFAVSLAVAVLGVTDAHATTFCVPNFHPACPNNGTNVAEADIQTATSTNATDGIADTVILDGQTISHNGSIIPTGSDPLTVVGQGPTTRVTSSMNGGNYYVMDLNTGGGSRQITLENFTIVIPAAMADNAGAAAQVANDTLENVDVESQNPGASGITSWIGGGTYRGGHIYATGGGTIGTAIDMNANVTGSVTIEDAFVDQPTGTAITNSGGASLVVRRSRIFQPGQSAIATTSGDTSVENTVIESKPNTTAIYALPNSAANAAITVDHVTAVSGGGNSAAYSVTVGAVTGNGSLTVKDSIERGYAATYLRQAQAASANGNANLTISYSNFHLSGSEVSSGDGTLTATTGNIDADPLFVSATDFQLNAGSPSIDAGDPAAGGLTEDKLKALRPLDGDGNGTAVRDQGAFEYQPPAPPDPPADPEPSTPVDPTIPTDPSQPTDPGSQDTTAPDTVKGKGPKAKIRKKSATFEFSSEPGASFRCTLDGKALGSCVSPMTVKRLKRGKHVFSVAAVDAAGNADQTPARWAFKVAKKHKRR